MGTSLSLLMNSVCPVAVPSQMLRTPDPPTAYNSGVLDWRTGQNRALKQVLVYLANGVTLINPHVFYRQPDEDDFETGIDLGGWERGLRGIKPKTAAFLMLAHLTNGYQPSRHENSPCTTQSFHRAPPTEESSCGRRRAPGAGSHYPGQTGRLRTGDLLPEGVLPDEVCYYDISVRDAAPLLLENLP